MVGSVDGEELLSLIDPRLLKVDYENKDIQRQIVFSTFLFFFVTYISSMIITPRLLSRYERLRSKEKVFWHLAVVRGIFGCFAGTFGLWALFADTTLDRDVVFGRTATSTFAICVTIGFFAFECLAVLLSDIYYRDFNVLLTLHHWVALVGYYIVLKTGAIHPFAFKGIVLEISTPFSALCWTMLKCGKEKTFMWKANQFILVHTFHCRSMIELHFWYMSYKNWNYIYNEMPTAAYYALYIQLALVTFVLTPYWTYKKTVQMIQPKDWNFDDSDKDVSLNGSAKKTQ